MPLGDEVLIDQETLKVALTITHTIYHHILCPPKMTKLSSKLNLTTLFYISPQKSLHPLKMTKLFPNSPGNYYYHHTPTSGYDQKTNTIIDPARVTLK